MESKWKLNNAISVKTRQLKLSEYYYVEHEGVQAEKLNNK